MGQHRVDTIGTVLDTNVICDLMRIEAWPWIRRSYGPLYVVQPIWEEELDDACQTLIREHVSAVNLTIEEWTTSWRLKEQFGMGLSRFDRAMLAVAFHRRLRCGSNDGPVHNVCRQLRIENIRTLGILTAANHAGVKTKQQCLAIIERIRRESQMRITAQILEKWSQGLR